MFLEGACSVEGIVAHALCGGLASLRTVEALGRAVAGWARVFAVALCAVFSGGVGRGAAFPAVSLGGGAVAPFCGVRKCVAA